MPRTSLRLAFALVALVATAGGALAQSAACRQARADLAGLGSGGNRTAMRLAQEQLGEIGRMQGQMRALQCEQGGFFGPSPDCQAVAQRIRAMEANYGALRQRAQAEGDVEQRRRRLLAAIDRFCDVEPTVEPVRATRAAPEPEAREGRRSPSGGGRMVCVRACDGFFFPLQNLPSGRGDADDMCQALCPGTETAAYSMPFDGTIADAVSTKGRPYERLANALRYTREVDRSCACRKPGQSWAQALVRAERMLARNGSDIVVTAAKAEELSRPKLLRPKVDRARREVADREIKVRPQEAFAVATTGSIGPASATPESATAARAGETAPTAGRESSGIGGQTPETPRVVAQGEGQAQARNAQGRPVRLIAPDVVAVPRTQ